MTTTIDHHRALFGSLELGHGGTPFVNALRADALAAFAAQGFPARKSERFRKLDVGQRFAEPRAITHPARRSAHDHVSGEIGFPDALAGIAFLDGLAADATGDEPGLVTGSDLESLREPLEPMLRRAFADDATALARLNLAFHHAEGVIEVPAGRALAAPIVLEHAFSEDTAETHPRSAIVVRRGAQAILVERWSAYGPARVNAHTDVVVEDGARLTHVIVHVGHEGASVFAGLGARVARDGAYTLTTLVLSDGLVRADVEVELTGEAAFTELHGLSLSRGRAVVDHWTRIVHRVGHATSRQRYKGVYDDASRGVFSGSVVFEKGAEKSDTAQSTRALLLSPDASADQKPELQIYADDVKASHGSTVGQLDEDALFYLRARGVPRDQAFAMLVHAFTADVVDALPPAVRESLVEEIDARVNALVGVFE